MNKEELSSDRQRLIQGVRGVVLEIGFGSGLNVPFYSDAVTKLYALEPSKELFDKSRHLIDAPPFPVEYLDAFAEHIPLPDGSVDFVVSTWTQCSVSKPLRALSEISRVLKQDGSFLFMEHGRSSNRFWALIQDIITPFTRLCDGNCHLNRDIETLLKDSELHIQTLDKIPEPYRPLDFGYIGKATK